ncbi:bifunctional riboflavin kinase/FMN phosphatase, partial [Tanacetum coccineum]
MVSLREMVSCVILDLDGTLVNTVRENWEGREALKIVGKKPIEVAAAIVNDYSIPLSKEDLLSKWCILKALPGDYRLINHLKGQRVKMALASNSPRDSTETKISYHPGWKESFSVIIGGDEVKEGKPSPE